MKLIYKFDELDNSKVKEVGGKNASLGEMFKELDKKGIRIPDGFASSAGAYWQFIKENEILDSLKETLSALDKNNGKNLREVGKKCREIIMGSSIPGEIEEAILQGYKDLKEREKSLKSVAVRSSATAEDLPDASFAGQHERFRKPNPNLSLNSNDRFGLRFYFKGLVQSFKSLLQVLYYIINILNTHGKPHQSLNYPGGSLLIGSKLLMGGGCRMDYKCFGIPDICKMAYQLQVIDESVCCFRTTPDNERQHSAETIPEISAGQ